MNKILIIEDDTNILMLERDYLEANDFAVDTETDGAKGLELALSREYDLILLDVMLPGLDGFEVCRKVRETKNTPILLVSAKKEDSDKISGLGFGADDYIVKPFSPSELIARVKAHIARYRRLTNALPLEESKVELDGLSLNKLSGVASLNGNELILTKKEFDLLFLLASNPNTIFTKNELFEKVWGYDSLGETSTLTVHINRIREKLKEIDESCEYIKTVWGRGYRFK
ncbi:MAG: response regulator transcription factor [Eubacterium sp.]|nr:response regulator transcription factor [Eubacterium sp.]